MDLAKIKEEKNKQHRSAESVLNTKQNETTTEGDKHAARNENNNKIVWKYICSKSELSRFVGHCLVRHSGVGDSV